METDQIGLSHMINSYSFGVIEIDGKRYDSDVIVYPDKVNDQWQRQQGHYLVPEDIRDVLDYRPQILVIGTGYDGVMSVSAELKKQAETLGIRLIVKKTAEAVRIFNKLIENRRVAALHLTC